VDAVPFLPLHEFDDTPHAVINPSRRRVPSDFPRRAVACWFGDLLRGLTADLAPIAHIEFEHGDHPVHVIERGGERIAVFNPGVGAPAAACSLEVVIALGATKVIGCGGAGIVVPGFDVGHVVVPTGAIRDDGTSYHYAPAHVDVLPHPEAVEAIDAVLTEAGIPHDRGLTWTTDAIFRETHARVARRREQGALTVEMEAAAMFAVASFRGVAYGQLLYAGDDVSAEEWDHRGWITNTSARQRLFDLACAAVLRL
jgi:uridine phosphorylase